MGLILLFGIVCSLAFFFVYVQTSLEDASMGSVASLLGIITLIALFMGAYEVILLMVGFLVLGFVASLFAR